MLKCWKFEFEILKFEFEIWDLEFEIWDLEFGCGANPVRGDILIEKMIKMKLNPVRGDIFMQMDLYI